MKKLILSILLSVTPTLALASNSEWREYEHKDAFSDNHVVRLGIYTPYSWGADMVAICENNKTRIYIDFKYYLSNKSVKVDYRFDDNKTKTNLWNISNDGTAVFSQKPIGFIKEMMKSEKLIIRARDYRGVAKTARFNVKGLSEKIGNLRKKCNW